MEKKHAVLISFLVTILVTGNVLFFYDFSSSRENAVIVRVLDGDTVELEDGRTVRLLNINAPEKNDFFYDGAKGFLKEFENKSVQVEIKGVDKYNRALGKIYSQEYINLKIIEGGFAHVYMVEKEEMKKFKNSEREAFENEKGIWKKSKYYGCIDVEINKNEEVISILVKCDISLKGWHIKDESTKMYVFGDIIGDRIILHSGKGDDKSDEIYWKIGNVWNDDMDSIFVRDQEGLLAYYDSYGY